MGWWSLDIRLHLPQRLIKVGVVGWLGTILFYFILFWWGKGGKCIMHCDARAPCVGLQYGSPLGTTARWTICRLTYPLKPSPAGWLGYIPLRKVDCQVWVCIEIDKTSIAPEGS